MLPVWKGKTIGNEEAGCGFMGNKMSMVMYLKDSHLNSAEESDLKILVLLSVGPSTYFRSPKQRKQNGRFISQRTETQLEFGT